MAATRKKAPRSTGSAVARREGRSDISSQMIWESGSKEPKHPKKIGSGSKEPPHRAKVGIRTAQKLVHSS